MWDAYEECQKQEKPPLGLKPKSIHDRERAMEIIAAMERYTNANKKIPREWICEIADLICEA